MPFKEQLVASTVVYERELETELSLLAFRMHMERGELISMFIRFGFTAFKESDHSRITGDKDHVKRTLDSVIKLVLDERDSDE